MLSALDWIANNPYCIAVLFVIWYIFGIVLFIDSHNKRR